MDLIKKFEPCSEREWEHGNEDHKNDLETSLPASNNRHTRIKRKGVTLFTLKELARSLALVRVDERSGSWRMRMFSSLSVDISWMSLVINEISYGYEGVSCAASECLEDGGKHVNIINNGDERGREGEGEQATESDSRLMLNIMIYELS
jgi:hypothetical protein